MASNDDPGFGAGLAVATVVWFFVGCGFFWNADRAAGDYKNHLEYGSKVCAQHGGFEASDNGGDFTCGDGVIIQKPDKTGG